MTPQWKLTNREDEVSGRNDTYTGSESNIAEDTYLKLSIAVRKPEGKDFSGLMRVLVRKGNTFFKETYMML